MIAPQDGTRYSMRLSVPRNGGWRAWGAVSDDFERRLAEQESPAVIVPHIESETRRGRDYVRITVSVEVSAPDVAQALTAPWSVFRQAASDDTAGWDLSSATAEVRPEEPLTAKPGVHKHAFAVDLRTFLVSNVPYALHTVGPARLLQGDAEVGQRRGFAVLVAELPADGKAMASPVLRVGGVVWQPWGARVPGGQMCKRFRPSQANTGHRGGAAGAGGE